MNQLSQAKQTHYNEKTIRFLVTSGFQRKMLQKHERELKTSSITYRLLNINLVVGQFG
jgi:hypothetical protein